MTPHRGDELVPDANMVFDRSRSIDASPEEIWPWLVQLGKRRAGWYAPRSVERLFPSSRRAIRTIDTRFQRLGVGDQVPDYGGQDAHLEVAEINPPHALIYRDERRGTPFSWAITLTTDAPGTTTVRLRFRGHLKSSGLTRRAILVGGGFFDGLTGEIMLRGLEERITAPAS